MDRITYKKPNYDKYDMNINLYSKFKNENVMIVEKRISQTKYVRRFTIILLL